MDVVKLFTLLNNTSSSRPHLPQYPIPFQPCYAVRALKRRATLGFGVQTPFQLILFHSLISFVPEYCYYYRQISQNGQTKHTTKCDHAPTYKDIRKLIF